MTSTSINALLRPAAPGSSAPRPAAPRPAAPRPAAPRPVDPAEELVAGVLAPTPREIARDLAGRKELWQPLVRFTQPRFYTRIATGPGWEAWLLTWLPGQSTGWHDHGGAAGAFAVLAGLVEEGVPVPRPLGSVSRGGVRRRSGATTHRHRAGQVRAFGTDHVHDVAARDGRAVTLHVYAPRLTTMTRYQLTRGGLEVTARERAGEDW